MYNYILLLPLSLCFFSIKSGRNEKGQLGVGDLVRRDVPTQVEALKSINIVAAACGRNHTLFLTGE